MTGAAGHNHPLQQIGVRPIAGGWGVSGDSFANTQLFRSGARAEDAARSLGARLAGAGYPSEVTIFLRNGAVGGRFICPAEDAE